MEQEFLAQVNVRQCAIDNESSRDRRVKDIVSRIEANLSLDAAKESAVPHPPSEIANLAQQFTQFLPSDAVPKQTARIRKKMASAIADQERTIEVSKNRNKKMLATFEKDRKQAEDKNAKFTQRSIKLFQQDQNREKRVRKKYYNDSERNTARGCKWKMKLKQGFDEDEEQYSRLTREQHLLTLQRKHLLETREDLRDRQKYWCDGRACSSCITLNVVTAFRDCTCVYVDCIL
eukprot:m.394780 g.394780  ORF g.394780 m.394780 type:complete len:233 (+) comp21092_c1_seq10:446-1144(+)